MVKKTKKSLNFSYCAKYSLIKRVANYLSKLLLKYIFFSLSHICRYISALSDDQEQPDLLKAISSGWPASLHLIGKVCHLCSFHFLVNFNLLKTILSTY